MHKSQPVSTAAFSCDVASVIDTLPQMRRRYGSTLAVAGLVCVMVIYWSKHREYMLWRQKNKILFMG